MCRLIKKKTCVVYNTCVKAKEKNPLDYGKQPASNQQERLLKSKPPYPKQFLKDIALQQQLLQKMLQLLSDTSFSHKLGQKFTEKK